MTKFETPMMKQYADIKKRHSDCILFFRLGDFYEMFMDDAKIGADILDITLTKRDRGKDGNIPMAGVPYHAAETYLNKLVRNGYKVAICEQVGDTSSPGLVQREVVRIVTPGTILDEGSLEKKENNYIVGVHLEQNYFGLSISDISTGLFQTTQYSLEKLEEVLVNELAKFNPAECVLPNDLYNDPEFLKILNVHQDMNIFPFLDWENYTQKADDFLEYHFGLKEISSFGIEDLKVAQKASAGLLGYLKYTQKDKISHITKITKLNHLDHMLMDRATLVNLEIFSTIRESKKRGSLINYLDKTTTSMGGRLLRNWVLHPLYNVSGINKRFDSVRELIDALFERDHLKGILQNILDIERLLSRLATNIGNPRDVIRLKESLSYVGKLKDGLEEFSSPLIKDVFKKISLEALNLAGYISVIIEDDPPADPKSGGLIKKGVSEEIDKLNKKIKKSKDFISKLEETEKKKTGISSLKVRFNKVFGYYIEITKANLDSVPKNYIRKQTLVNSERFITEELKKHEEIILTAEEKLKELEFEKFEEVISHILKHTKLIQQTAEAVAEIDCLICFADLAAEHNLTRPSLSTSGAIEIEESRHPVVEELLESGEFVSNDVLLNQKDHQLLIVTGPNMAGKSVYIRQVAINVLMAQIGCFVPASKAKVSLVDKIFVRSGANDVISRGLSTFMVEMVEAANILNNATSQSLIIMDEIGRGTSTYDGISIAWAVAEYLVANKKIKPKTLFATHYHELQDLEEKYPDKIKNYQILVDSSKGDPIFLHKVAAGGAGHSFGISVAKMAGVPQEVCDRAEEILKELKVRSKDASDIPHPQVKEDSLSQEVIEILNDINLSTTTPIEALNILNKIKEKIDA